MQAQQQRPATSSEAWNKIFPPAVSQRTESALFTKKLLAVAVSNLAYLRGLFPESAFGDRMLEGP